MTYYRNALPERWQNVMARRSIDPKDYARARTRPARSAIGIARTVISRVHEQAAIAV